MATAFDWRRDGRDLEAQFKSLHDSTDPTGTLHAVLCRRGEWPHWALAGGPEHEPEREHLQSQFRLLATHAGICAGAPFCANALDWWLNLLVGDGEPPPYIREVIRMSEDKCREFANSAVTLGTVVVGGPPTRLRRDSYPEIEWSWLYDHHHSPEPKKRDPKADHDFWEAHIWQGYKTQIQADAGTETIQAQREADFASWAWARRESDVGSTPRPQKGPISRRAVVRTVEPELRDRRTVVRSCGARSKLRAGTGVGPTRSNAGISGCCGGTPERSR